MSKPTLSKFFKNISSDVSKHSPEILTGIGIAGMVATTILAVKATPKACRLIREAEVIYNEDVACIEDERPLPKIEVVKACWKCYIPAAVTGATSIACLIGASAVNLRRNAALTAAYTLSDTALREYREKVIETVGEKKEQNVRNAVAKGQVEKNPVSKNEILIPDKGTTLCYDPITARYFKSDHDKLKKAENEINSMMLEDGCVSINDFYYEIGLDNARIGDDLGWSYSRDRLVKLNLSSQLAEDGTPCIVLDFQTAPYYNYDKF